MKTATHSEREQFVALLIRNCPTATASTCQRLMRLGGTYNRLARSHDRSVYQTEKLDIITRRIASLARSLGMVPAFCPTSSNSLVLVRGEVNIPIPTS